jgi:tetratricopeptide (TPR) repeat protein
LARHPLALVVVGLVGIALAGCRSTGQAPWVHQAIAQRELEEGNAGNAITILEECQKRNPEFAPTYLSLAAAWSQRGNVDEFRKNLERYLALNPSHHVARLYLAEAALRQEDLDVARTRYQEYIDAETASDRKASLRKQHAFERLSEIARASRDESAAHFLAACACHQAARAEINDMDPDQGIADAVLRARDWLEQSLNELDAVENGSSNDHVRRQREAVLKLLDDLDRTGQDDPLPAATS